MNNQNEVSDENIEAESNDNANPDESGSSDASKTTEPTLKMDDVSFGIKDCDDYVKLLNCVIKNAPENLRSIYEQ